MRRKSILFALGILGMTCAACGPVPQPGVGEGKVGLKVATCTFDPTKVVELDSPALSPFFPAVYSNCVAQHLDNPALCRGPTGTSNPLPASYANTIQAAFNGGSDQFKRAMCTVDKFFITTGPLPLRNWGMRVPNPDPSQNKRFIGLNKRAFSGSYSDGEKEVLHIISGIPDSSFSRVNVSVSPSTSDTVEMKVRAILAHEMAHILWWDYRNNILNPSTCSNGIFFLTWSTPITPPARGYHNFAEEITGNTPIEGYRLLKVISDNRNGNYANLDQIYDDGNWAGLFSFIAPDEDFAETYKLWVLTTMPTGGLTSLKTTIPTNSSANDTKDVIQYINNTNSSLSKKVHWIDNSNCLPVP